MKWQPEDQRPLSDIHARALSWKEVEQLLSGTPDLHIVPRAVGVSVDDAQQNISKNNKDVLINSLSAIRDTPNIPYCELHACSSYNFLHGAADPEEMVAAARAQQLQGLALLDRDGFYGAVLFANSARADATAAPLRTVFGAELTLPQGILPVLCKGAEGYRRLSRIITNAQMSGGEKGQVRYPSISTLGKHADGHWIVLAGYEWREHLGQLHAAFGRDVVLEYVLSMQPNDADEFAALDSLAARYKLRGVLTTRACAATRNEARLAAAKQALACRRSIDTAQPDLHPMGASWLRSGHSLLKALGGQRSELLAESVAIAEECAFSFDLIAPQLPNWKVPEGHSEQSWLEHVVWQRLPQRYRGSVAIEQARAQAHYELGIIDKLGFPGYFLIVDDIVQFCKDSNILCQGRGSAANSVVCFALGITNVDPISAGLLFERFLSPEREGMPDIDIDIESGRREEVIQYVYRKYGRDNAAQVANVISYRSKGAIRDAARALGYPAGVIDNWTKKISQVPPVVSGLAQHFHGQPRHLGIHSGGMVICDRAISEVVPIEWARKDGRSVVQWDKDSCADVGLIKFDLLGLGMLEALHHMIDLVEETTGKRIHLWELDVREAGVYEMLSRGDAIGVFQVESRAQLNTLPRLKPQCFFDLVVEIALIRPGPIQGGSVHPYLRRRQGKEPVTYEHPVLEKALKKTLGVPLFQEQLMQIAIDAAGFSGGEADQLRRAMGSKRSPQRMAALQERFYQGLKDTNGIVGPTAAVLWNKIVAFAAYGFPESHSQSFASLVFFSAWFKLHYPAEFCVGLLRAQPMGFYSPQSLLADARRHGVEVLPIDINESSEACRVVPTRRAVPSIRLGLNMVKTLSNIDRIVAGQPYRDVADLARRADLNVAHIEALAEAGALDCFGVDRRQALWQAGIAATENQAMLPGLSMIEAPVLPAPSALDLTLSDLRTTGVTHDHHPLCHARKVLCEQGVVASKDLLSLCDGTRIQIAGVVTHRQRPRTAGGVTFFGMEDEYGLINVVVSPGLWERNARVARTSNVLLVRGIVRNSQGVAQVEADALKPLPMEIGLGGALRSRDFH